MMQETSLSALKDWLTVIALIVGLLSPMALFWLKSQFPTRADIEKLLARFAEAEDLKSMSALVATHAAKIDIVEDRISKVEGHQQHLPSKDAVHEMALSLSEMRGEVKALAERLTPITSTTQRLQDFLLEQAKK